MAVRLGDRLRSVVGGATAKKLGEHLDLHSVEDLLRHYPRRYVRRGELTALSRLVPGEHVTVQAEVVQATNKTFGSAGSSRRRRPPVRTEVVVSDGTGARLLLTFFNQSWRASQLRAGTLGLFAGKVGDFRGQPQLLHPECEILEEGTEGRKLTRPLIPIYPASLKVNTWVIAASVAMVLDVLDPLPDPLPAEVRERHGLRGINEAFEGIHRPDEPGDWQQARDRFRYEEALLTQVALVRRRRSIAALPAVPRQPVADGLAQRFEERLPFALTAGQRRVGAEIAADLCRDHPMHRLLQGEVGSGKTVVALRAMLQVVDGNGQAALLAPTEVLAQQHHRSLTALLGELAMGGMLGGAEVATRVRLVTGSLGAAARREALLDAASGAAGIVVGTHALLEDRVQFADLGLVVVDEQHRFGVEQRAALTERGGEKRPHVLVMTATPIPRTVAMTVFGDLDTSLLAEVPPGRLPVQTTVVPTAERPEWLQRAWDRVREECAQGRQAYVVCPRIGAGVAGEEPVPAGVDDPATPPTTGVLELATELRAGPLAGLRVEALHGRLTPEAKDTVMDRFGAGDIDVLVATTVVEVGVDVPNATVMVVMDAERFGLSQLHQLRGRVGRGAAPGLCLLVTDAPVDVPARERLDAIAATDDGFAVSQLDVSVRREGDVLGVSQSGRRSSLRLLSVVEHEEVIARARADAISLVEADPGLTGAPALSEQVLLMEATARADFLEKA
ncbi:MAG: ATP-dependent helicase RecG [Nocardioidaceae bacterium]|jgi:ATP-dependent DNA helicase RecG|nr:ATP-dependent helicase RecG [Nocardioidaceae bacterium]